MKAVTKEDLVSDSHSGKYAIDVSNKSLGIRFGKENVRVHKGCNFFRLDKKELPEILDDSKWADAIVFAGGNNPVGYSGGENDGKNKPLMKYDAVTSFEGYDVTDIGLTESQKGLLENLKKLQKPLFS